MSTPQLSVVICTHRPRPDYLARTVGGLEQQTLPASQWELLVIDNASPEPLSAKLSPSGQLSFRIILEPELGLTPARLRAIAEARGEILLFVDDDNVLAANYLERALAIGERWPQLGVWGCGSFAPEWETPPPPQFGPYLAYLAVHRAARDRWSNRAFDYEATPAGAGLCVRAPVARSYSETVRADPRRKKLGRTGGNLTACEDFDLALTAIDLGHGVGVFTELAMTHLMPRGRVEEAYLLRLVEGHAYSTVLLHSWRDPNFTAPGSDWLSRVREFRLRRSLDPVARKIHDARRRGEKRAWADLANSAG